MERKVRKNPRLSRDKDFNDSDSEVLDVFLNDFDDHLYHQPCSSNILQNNSIEENKEMDIELLKVGEQNQKLSINIETATERFQPDDMVFSISNISHQEPDNCDPKEKPVPIYEPGIMQMRHNTINEEHSKMVQFKLDEPSTSKSVQFREDISYGLSVENEENGQIIEQENSNSNMSKPMPILCSKPQSNKESLSQKKAVRFNIFPTYKFISKCTDNIDCVSNNESDSSDDLQQIPKYDCVSNNESDSSDDLQQIPKYDKNLDEEPGSSHKLEMDENSCNEIKVCDSKNTYFGVKMNMDIRELQCKVRLKNPESFKVYLKKQVYDIKVSILEAQSDSSIKIFIDLLCPKQFIHGNCENKECELFHKLPLSWCNELEDSLRLALVAYILNNCHPPLMRLGEPILNWLVKEHKSTYEILYISEYFLSIDDETNKTIWRVILNSLVACGLEEWEAVSWILVYHYDNVSIITNYLDIENRNYAKYWKSFRPLIQLGFFLTEGIMKQMLTQMCTDPNKIKNFSKGAVSFINEQVECLNLESTFNLLPLIKSFIDIQKKIFINVDQMPLKYEILPRLKSALEIEDITSIAKIVVDYSKTKRCEEVLSKIFIELISFDRICYLIEAIIKEIDKTYAEREHAKLFIGWLCITCIIIFVEAADWKIAYHLLTVLVKSGINPITLQPPFRTSSEVTIALLCSKIYFYNARYNSSIMVLTDLVEFYEPLLCNMLYQVDKYKDQILPFYGEVESIDSTIMLTGLSYRALLVLSYHKKRFRFAKEMTIKAINCCVYFPYDKEENVMYIVPCMVPEEMRVYLMEWLRHYYEHNGCQEVELSIKFMEHASHHIKGKNSLVFPNLSLADYSPSAALNRFIDGLDALLKTTLPRPINETNNVKLSVEYFKELIKLMRITDKRKRR